MNYLNICYQNWAFAILSDFHLDGQLGFALTEQFGNWVTAAFLTFVIVIVIAIVIAIVHMGWDCNSWQIKSYMVRFKPLSYHLCFLFRRSEVPFLRYRFSCVFTNCILIQSSSSSYRQICERHPTFALTEHLDNWVTDALSTFVISAKSENLPKWVLATFTAFFKKVC